MKFYGYSMVYDGKKVGEMISASDDPKVAANEWLEKIPSLLTAGIRRTLRKEPGLLVAERL
ncbi:MAG: hypothetical protein M1267_02655 [Candidatus Thermoplasmatota archaeon]|jgi:hypothetical protein|nr:hypothetical protein [Candidatus Thermoplasmatota archaeon]MCL5800388.1 hypothetical protein [Candidatus Thermoplasmatota archaeon]